MVVLVEAGGGFRDAHRQEGPMPLAERVGDPAVEGRDVNIGENAGLNAVIGLAVVVGLVDFFLTGFACTYLDSNPFRPPLF